MNIIKRILIFALSSCIILSLFLSDTGRRTRFLTTLAGPGMLSLVSQSLNIPPQNTALLLKNPATPSSTSKITDITTISAKESPRIALTFDDGPNATYTPLLLDGLRERNIHASFFLVGENIEGNEGILQQMQKDGHLIGNHTWDHVQLDKISVPKARLEIEKTNNRIYEVTGTYPSYVRPPFGAWIKDMELSVTMLPVFWDVDTLDWKRKASQPPLHCRKEDPRRLHHPDARRLPDFRRCSLADCRYFYPKRLHLRYRRPAPGHIKDLLFPARFVILVYKPCANFP